MEIRILHESDAAVWWQIRLEALESEPFAFGKAAAEHRATPVETIAERFRNTSRSAFTVGAFADGKLAGIATFVREPGEKERHKGRIYGVYVSASHRGQGMGRALLTRLLDTATQDASLEQVLLAVATSQKAASELYRSLGFVSLVRSHAR